MTQFVSFIRKEFLHIFRDRRTMLILLGMPIVQILIFGFAITTEVKNVPIAFLDFSKDESTQQIIQKFAANEYFYIAETPHSYEEANQLFKEGKISMAVVFGSHFNENLIHLGHAPIQLIADATDPNTAKTATGYATNIISTYQQELLSQYKIPGQIVPEVRMLYNPQLKGAYNFVPGVMGLILMLICAMMTSFALVREKEMGTMEILLASPMRPLYVILSKAIPYALLSCVNLATILLLSVYVIHVPVVGNLGWLLLLSFIFIVTALALGLLISTVANNQVSAMLISGMLMMIPVMLLSGMIFPIENMPLILQWLSHIIPARWYISGVRKIMIEGLPITMVYKEFLILFGMALFLIFVSLKKFKVRLE